MTSRTRLYILLVTAPIISFAVIGGILGKAQGRDDPYRHLQVFEDVIALMLNNYVEEVDLDKVMRGAMHGLTEALDPDSAYLNAEQVRLFEQKEQAASGETGLELTRQYYLRIISARDGSPAAKAGLLPGDYVRAIDGQPTRDMSVYHGMRLLAGVPGSGVTLTVIRGNAAEPHEVKLVREILPGPAVTGRLLSPEVGYLRVVEFDAGSAGAIRATAEELKRDGARSLVIDVRRTARGSVSAGVEAARVFVPKGTLAVREAQGGVREEIAAAADNNGNAVMLPALVLIDAGTSGPAEVFAAALSGNGRAELVGERTLGRTSVQELVKLPDGSGLLLSTAWYKKPDGEPITAKGIVPDTEVEQPDVEFGAAAPSRDPVLEKALERLNTRKAA
jgi:carboxyl-terminal processing protease